MSKWIEWGGETDMCPVPKGKKFEARRRDGRTIPGHAVDSWKWSTSTSSSICSYPLSDIIAYRILEDDMCLGQHDPDAKDFQPKPGETTKSDGSTASYYELPEGATELQHLISHNNMNAQIGEIFRACYRYGRVAHSEMLRDAKKMKYYAEAEIERLTKVEK